jgi:hypothetical protein
MQVMDQHSRDATTAVNKTTDQATKFATDAINAHTNRFANIATGAVTANTSRFAQFATNAVNRTTDGAARVASSAANVGTRVAVDAVNRSPYSVFVPHEIKQGFTNTVQRANAMAQQQIADKSASLKTAANNKINEKTQQFQNVATQQIADKSASFKTVATQQITDKSQQLKTVANQQIANSAQKLKTAASSAALAQSTANILGTTAFSAGGRLRRRQHFVVLDKSNALVKDFVSFQNTKGAGKKVIEGILATSKLVPPGLRGKNPHFVYPTLDNRKFSTKRVFIPASYKKRKVTKKYVMSAFTRRYRRRR